MTYTISTKVSIQKVWDIMLIEGNNVYGNEKYGIDPHTGTHHMIIRNNIVYDNYNAGIICSAECYNIIIEGNKVYNNGHGDNLRGIPVSKNVSNTIIKNNIVYDEMYIYWKRFL